MEAEVQLHLFLISALRKGECAISHSSRFVPGEKFSRKVGGPHNDSGCFVEQKNLLHLPEFELRIVHPVA
jgi:hypothetical protein